MKKEVFLAIFIGILFGFGVSGLLWVKNNQDFYSLKEKITKKEVTPSPSPKEEKITPSPTEEKKIFLSITEPENETVTSKAKITLRGKTLPLATVVIIWEEGEDILVADEEGLFESEISLVGGPNQIEVTAYDENDNEAKEVLLVTYSTAKF